MNANSLKRKERDRQVRKTDILSAAERVFALKGYEKATMQDIAKEAQYAAGTVYLYFKDKDALYFSLLEEKISAMMSVVIDKTSGIKKAKEKIKLFIQASFDFFEKDIYFSRIFISETRKFHWAIDKKITTSPSLSKHMKYLVDLIKMAQKQGVVRNDYSANQLADIFVAAMGTTIVELLKNGYAGAEKVKKGSDFVFNVFMNGVSA